MVYFSTEIFGGVGMTEDAATCTTLGFSSVLIVMTVLSLFLVDSVGRRRMMLFSFTGMAIFTLILLYTLVAAVSIR